MYNANNPDQNELPSSAQLLRSTLLALVGAAVVLATVVLPAEYGIDPTGLGDALGLKRMGEIKTQLAEEASAGTLDEATAPIATPAPGPEAPSMAVNGWRDETVVSIAPDAAIELKLIMSEATGPNSSGSPRVESSTSTCMPTAPGSPSSMARGGQ